MKGISDGKAVFYRERNLAIYDAYFTSSRTMEEIAESFHLTRQRVWQIIRRCQIGEGDYYEGYQNFREKKEKLEEKGFSEDEVHYLMRQWLVEKHRVKIIRLKDERI